jgi:hypothetical protein
MTAPLSEPRDAGGAPTLADHRDVVRRRRLALSEIPREDQKLVDVLQYWTSKRRNDLLPAREDIDIMVLRPVLGRTHLIDVTAEDPADYRIRLYGTMTRVVSSGRLDNPNNPTNLRLGSYPSEPYRKALMEDYHTVCLTGVPCYQQVVANIDYIAYSYSRLILPMAQDGRKVDTLMVCINPRKFSDFTI